MSSRTGRNFRYAAAGHALTALSMGAAGTYFSPGAIFVTAACLCVIRPEEIDYARARNAAKVERGIRIDSVFTLAKNRSLLLFAGCVVHRSFRFWVRIWRGERAHPRF
jgi:hypothetical protein